MDVFLTIILIVVFLLMEAFFSGSEIGVVSADQIKLRHDAAKGSRGAQVAPVNHAGRNQYRGGQQHDNHHCIDDNAVRCAEQLVGGCAGGTLDLGLRGDCA